MGCRTCGGGRQRTQQTYKYLTRSQILERFNRFKEESCKSFCEFVDNCDIDIYRSCRKKQKSFGLI